MQEIAYAKLNLALHVRAREADGYHRIETLFAFCEDGDLLAVAEGDGIALEVTGPFAAALAGEPDNLVLRAARALWPDGEAALTLDKRLPVAAGLGGGSADAAAALRLLARFWGLSPQRLGGIAVRLGADLPACLGSVTARGEGRGDLLRPVAVEGLAGTPVLLVNPGVPLATAAVFAGWDGVDRGPLGDWREGRNDLQAPAIALVPEIADVLAALADARIARMSGSGATCFGLYPGEAESKAAATRISADNPGWWVSQTRLR
jgi:4-diphosphocytidyl-2-C-methyl-D-erythritol kinase